MWDVIFKQVQSGVREAQYFEQALENAILFAVSNPAVFEEREYWSTAQRHDFQPSFSVLTGWAKEGLSAIGPSTGWQFLVLDMGDCPDTFRIYSPGGQILMSEQQFGRVLSTELIISPSEMELCFEPDTPEIYDTLFESGASELCAHHVSELGDRFLGWTSSPKPDFGGNSGYFLWLMLGSLALVEPLRDASNRKAILQGRDKLHLLSGYEEIFCYLATITPQGLVYEPD